MSAEIAKRLVVPDERGDVAQEVRRYLLAALIAVLPCYAIALKYFGTRILLMVVVACASGTVVELIFAKLRKRPVSGGWLVYSLLLVLILPHDLPLWMVGVGAALGSLFGKEVFGGTGWHVFNPVLVAKASVVFGYPSVAAKGVYFGSLSSAEVGDARLACSVAILVGAAILVAANWQAIRVLLGLLAATVAVGGVIMVKGALPYDTMLELIMSDGYLFCACLLACDPATAPRNPTAKILYGALIGAVAMIMRSFSNYTEAMMCAVLFGNLFAPTLDAVAEVSLHRESQDEEQ